VISVHPSADRFEITYLPPNAPICRLASLTTSHR
jgi:hypothetical protein